MAVVSISSVSKSFGGVPVVKDVSFEVCEGEIFGLLGPNGAGKTTTIRMVLDIFRPDAGEIAVFDGKLDQAKRRRIGYLPEERGLYKDQTVEQVLVYFACLKGLAEGEARARLVPWLTRLDLYEHRRKRIQDLSKGMQQKAQLIATLLHDPDLIIVDEPFSGLDPVNTRLVKDIMEEQRQAGKCIIMSTHQMYQVEALCTRIVLINRGQVVLYGDVEQIKHNAAGNAVVVEGQGDWMAIPGVLEARPANGSYRLALAKGTRPQDVFHALARQDVRIDRFEVAEPSLDDIFISAVQGDSQPQEVSYA